MRNKHLQRFVIASAFTLTASAQAMIENSIAAAGGTAAGIAGKKISDGISLVFGKSAAEPQEVEVAPTPALKRIPSGETALGMEHKHKPVVSAPAIAEHSAATFPVVRHVAAVKQPVQRPQQLTPPITPAYALSHWVDDTSKVPVATATTIAHVQVGTDVGLLGPQLGVPSARVMIPGGDGRMLQLIRYRDYEGLIGVIHVADGQVSQVEVR